MQVVFFESEGAQGFGELFSHVHGINHPSNHIIDVRGFRVASFLT